MEFENLPFSTIVENYKIDYFLFHSVCYGITVLIIISCIFPMIMTIHCIIILLCVLLHNNK